MEALEKKQQHKKSWTHTHTDWPQDSRTCDDFQVNIYEKRNRKILLERFEVARQGRAGQGAAEKYAMTVQARLPRAQERERESWSPAPLNGHSN